MARDEKESKRLLRDFDKPGGYTRGKDNKDVKRSSKEKLKKMGDVFEGKSKEYKSPSKIKEDKAADAKRAAEKKRDDTQRKWFGTSNSGTSLSWLGSTTTQKPRK